MHCPACRHPHLAQLYRIAQEAVANAVKHARAGRILVSLACPAGREAILAVRDDGCGQGQAKASAGGLGLGIMAHRARVIGGELRIGDAPGGGTEVVCTAPCPGAGQDLEAAPSGSAA
jgi:signal transduction histidine kinase